MRARAQAGQRLPRHQHPSIGAARLLASTWQGSKAGTATRQALRPGQTRGPKLPMVWYVVMLKQARKLKLLAATCGVCLAVCSRQGQGMAGKGKGKEWLATAGAGQTGQRRAGGSLAGTLTAAAGLLPGDLGAWSPLARGASWHKHDYGNVQRQRPVATAAVAAAGDADLRAAGA